MTLHCTFQAVEFLNAGIEGVFEALIFSPEIALNGADARLEADDGAFDVLNGVQ